MGPGLLAILRAAPRYAHKTRCGADLPLVLHDVSFSIQPGQFVAFVGASGSGKSTLFRMLPGFERPHSGGVYFDGQDISGLDIQEVRRQMGVVLQSGKLLPGDILTNIPGAAPSPGTTRGKQCEWRAWTTTSNRFPWECTPWCRKAMEQLQITRIVIAHRLSTILKANRIFVMDRGVVVQSGTYNELIDQPGPFADLAKRQMTRHGEP